MAILVGLKRETVSLMCRKCARRNCGTMIAFFRRGRWQKQRFLHYSIRNGARNAAKFHSKTDSFAEFLGKVKLTHPSWRYFPRYARQYVDSTFVSEPQRYCMLFAMISSFAEYILESRKGEKGHPSGDQLAEDTFKHFGLDKSAIDDIIKEKGLKRGNDDINTVAGLRNEAEHNLFSNVSYAFLEDNPKINLFMEDIAARIIFDFIQVEYS